MNLNQHQQHTITHKLDPAQFAALLHILSEAVTGDDPVRLNALTARLKASADALSATTKQAQP